MTRHPLPVTENLLMVQGKGPTGLVWLSVIEIFIIIFDILLLHISTFICTRSGTFYRRQTLTTSCTFYNTHLPYIQQHSRLVIHALTVHYLTLSCWDDPDD
ncbi:hypothetical protein E1B28_007061 [Marasmius oreades]|uniref:Uncharacterized protein n=1 Tax=Marasmius oreades TaxID=181124 RepID=A0A9P7UTN0_9AGAR|nr:uncharacterized protein E1B28_007061 [Marasmius oreades]KAG7093380.1 hypothetical protein E1B28_007061 [Marasmius oreades]